MHIRHLNEYVDPLFSVYLKPHKTGFRIEDSKFVKRREIIGFINFSELLNKLCLELNPY